MNLHSTLSPAQAVAARREAVVATARRLIGVPYLHQERDPRVGLDCGGLVIVSLLRNGWVPRFEDSLRQDYRPPDDAWMEETVAREWRQVEVVEVAPADVLLFAWPFRAHAEHMALVSEHNGFGFQIVHTAPMYGRVVEHDLEREFDGTPHLYGMRFCGAWRVPMLEEA